MDEEVKLTRQVCRGEGAQVPANEVVVKDGRRVHGDHLFPSGKPIKGKPEPPIGERRVIDIGSGAKIDKVVDDV